MRTKYYCLWLALPLILILAGGCVFSPTKVPPPPPVSLYLPQDSPANCLTNLITAYVQRDLDGYKALFASDFIFVFSPTDVENPTNPTPQRWGLPDEDASADKMFHSELVDKIDLSFTQAPAVDSGSENAGTWKVLVSQVNLLIYTRQDGQPWIYRVNGGTATFYFKEYPQETASNGKPLWRIWEWMDQPISFGPQAQVAARHSQMLRGANYKPGQQVSFAVS